MRRVARQLTIELVGEASKFIKSLDDAEKKSQSFGDRIQDVGKKMTAFVSVPVAAFLGAATKAAAEDEQQQAQLAKTLENTVGASDKVTKSVEAQILKWQKVSTFADDQLRPAFENLVRSTGNVEQANKLMATAMDIAAARGLPLEQVTLAMSKAHDGNVGALGRLGIATKDASGKTLEFDEVMANATKTFGGSAQAALDTTAGKSQAFKRDLGELTESIGTALLPILERFTGWLQAIIEKFQNLSPGVQTAIVVALGLAAAIGPLIGLVTALGTAFAFVAANPIVLIIAGIVALGAGLVIAYQKCETFRDIVNAAFDAVKWIVGNAIANMLQGFAWLLTAISEVANLAAKVPGPWQGAMRDVAGAIGTAREDINGFIANARTGFEGAAGSVGRFTGALRELNSVPINQASPIVQLGGLVRARQHGGPVAAGSPYLVGEKGPELFVPGQSGSISPGGTGPTYNINITGALDPDAVAKQLREMLASLQRRGGKLGFGAA
jgi:phage-related protein